MIIAMLTAISVHYLDQVTSCYIRAILSYLDLTSTKRTMPKASPSTLSLTSSSLSSRVLIMLMFLAIIQITSAMETGVPPIESPLAATITGAGAAIAVLHHGSRLKSTEDNDEPLYQ